MSQDTFRVEIGAWVESTTPKASGKGMRKVWVAPTPKGEAPRLSVIRAGERGDVHVLTLHVGTEIAQSEALEVLSLALDALGALPAFSAPAPAPRVKTPAKAPTPPKAPDAATVAANRAIAIAAARSGKPAATRNPAPAKVAAAPVELDWFATLMHNAGAV